VEDAEHEAGQGEGDVDGKRFHRRADLR
jgi:hypothetical protein